MSIVEGPGRAALITRVQNIILRPNAEWDAIDGEAATTQGLFTGYAMILAAIPAVARMIGGFFPTCVFGVCVHMNPLFVVIGALVNYVVGLAGVFVIGLIIDALAPSFDGQKNQIQAMKVAVYSFTATWLAGIFLIIPALGILSIVGLYSLYLLYLGLPKLMKSPPDKALVYTIVAVVAGIVVFVVAGAIGAAVASMGAMGSPLTVGSNAATVSGKVNVGGASVDLGQMQRAAIQAQGADGKPVAAVDPEKLKAFLPASVAGLPRTTVTAQTAGAAGMSGSSAEAEYTRDDAHITVTVTDLAAAGAFAGMASAMGVQSSKETASGYEKIGKVNGRMTTEEWDRNSKSGKYGVLVANRFMVEADGNAPSIDDLKAAVSAVGPDRLEGLARS